MGPVKPTVNDSNLDARVTVLASLFCGLVNLVAEVIEPFFCKCTERSSEPETFELVSQESAHLPVSAASDSESVSNTKRAVGSRRMEDIPRAVAPSWLCSA